MTVLLETRMKKRLLLFAIPLLALLNAGCIRVHQKLVLNADATGTLEVEYSVPDETSQRIKAMLHLADELATAGGGQVQAPAEDDFTRLVFDPQEADIRKRIAVYEPLGLRVEELEVQARNARRDVKLRLSFSNVVDLARADFFSAYGFSIAKTTGSQYAWYTRALTTEKPDAEWRNDPDAVKLMAPLLGGFHWDIEVQVPGVILRSNAGQKTPYTAQWTYDFDANRDALADFQTKSMTLVFDTKGMAFPEVLQPKPSPEAPPAVPSPPAPAATNSASTPAPVPPPAAPNAG